MGLLWWRFELDVLDCGSCWWLRALGLVGVVFRAAFACFELEFVSCFMGLIFGLRFTLTLILLGLLVASRVAGFGN